jgi:hypothetical protein
MRDTLVHWLKRFFDRTALDWFWILLNESKRFPHETRPAPTRSKIIEESLTSADESLLDYIIGQLEKSIEGEEQRRATIEGKATNISGFSGVLIALLAGFANALLEDESIIISVLFFVVILALVMTITLSVRALRLRGSQQPNVKDILRITSISKPAFLRSYAAALLVSYEDKQAVDNDRGTYLLGAEDWFRNAMIMLTILVLAVVIGRLSIQVGLIQPTPKLQWMILVTPTAVTTPTLGVISPPSPSPTVVPSTVPTARPTALPLPTPTPSPQITTTSIPTLTPSLPASPRP